MEARVLVPAPAETKEWVCTEARVGAEAVEVETGEGWGGGRDRAAISRFGPNGEPAIFDSCVGTSLLGDQGRARQALALTFKGALDGFASLLLTPG